MTTPITQRTLLEYTIRLMHLEKTLALLPGVNDTVVATLLGTDLATYHEIQEGLRAQVLQTARDLLADNAFAALVDRLPFAPGAKVIGFGSSTTDDSLSWLELLRAVMEQRRPQDRVRFINAGVSGDTTTHEIARMNTVTSEHPDWIICHISSNDGRRHGTSPIKPLVSPEETAKNLVMLRHFASSQTTARWVWMTPTPLLEERVAEFPLFQASQVRFFSQDTARIVDLVLKQPDPVVNLWELFGQPTDPELVFWDGLHPSLQGQKRILRALVSKLVARFS